MAEPHAGREEARRLRPTRSVAHDRPVPSDVEAPARRPAGVRTMMPGAEQRRLEEANASLLPWKRWGPYLSERQWGTVREDYSDTGEAWEYFPHDHARSRAYRWGEDGIAGISDDKQRLCFAIALWNGADSILKERLFGLSNAEGNHGEDVKEYYYYLDCTPTHSYMRYLYKYPQRAFPYADLVETNRRRSRRELEYELIDTGVFDDDRYFDVFVEYAKATPDDILIRITAANRGAGPAPLHLLPTLWYRNRWTWRSRRPKPTLAAADGGAPGRSGILASHYRLGQRFLVSAGEAPLLFCENETNTERLFGIPNQHRYVKDGINDHVVHGGADTVNPARTGTKAAAQYRLTVPPGESAVVRLRFTEGAPADPSGEAFDDVFRARAREADEFYDSITPASLGADERRVMRQALAGMLWNKQYYYYDLDRWLAEHDAHPGAVAPRPRVRNREWFHVVNDDIISMPDKWEYPWYAAWDLGFHAVALGVVDLEFAKQQVALMLSESYLHPNGQIPAYEWNFNDVNPPVHAWATLFLYNIEKAVRGHGDVEFLSHAFQKLLMNFTWWVNRKDPSGSNVFEGGFLGLDNIGVFDRSAPLPTGGFLEQADGTAWMALFCQNMLEIALELAAGAPAYEHMALKFVEHFLWIAAAMNRVGGRHDRLWDEADGFFYDQLRLPDGRAVRLKVRSLVGLLPLCAATVIEADLIARFPSVVERVERFLAHHPELVQAVAPLDRPGVAGRRMLALLDEAKLRRVLARMLDEEEFLSPFGIRSLSRYHRDQPYVRTVEGQEYRVDYEPAEYSYVTFGGNSNWRGPIWAPINALLIRALLQLYAYYGAGFTVDCPTGSGRAMNLFEVSAEIARRLASLFVRDERGRRPVFGGAEKLQTDPHFRAPLLLYEYFHGDNGAGIGASHQTGWTGLVARLLQLYADASGEQILEAGRQAPAKIAASLYPGHPRGPGR